MEYAIGVYDISDIDSGELQNKTTRLINIMAKQRWRINWIGTSYRETRLIVIFERVRTE
jgi:hypothetical protein